jgi:hypothetical protein
MHVIRQDDPRIYFKRPFGFRETNGLAQEVDFSNKQIALPICQGDGEEDWRIGEFGAAVVGHVVQSA